MLIATLPPVYREELLEEIISTPEIGGVRYNTGILSPFSALETLAKIKNLTDQHKKKFWIDLKGRQLRVTKWAFPDYGTIELNHNISIDGLAQMVFRDGDTCDIKFVRRNKIFLNSRPRQAVGEGQSVNILGDGVVIEGYLTGSDREYITAAAHLGVTDFMLSFIEEENDIFEVGEEYQQALEGMVPARVVKLDLALKIESPRGVDFITKNLIPNQHPHTLVAARDDLFSTIGDNKAKILPALEEISNIDKNAILASRIFSGIEKDSAVTMADLSDLDLMIRMGYKSFMFSDEICQRYFQKAIRAWKMYWDVRAPNFDFLR